MSYSCGCPENFLYLDQYNIIDKVPLESPPISRLDDNKKYPQNTLHTFSYLTTH